MDRKTLIALGVGSVAGVAVNEIIVILQSLGDQHSFLLTKLFLDIFLDPIGIVLVLTICVPIWKWLAGYGRQGFLEAVILGFTAVFAIGLLPDLLGSVSWRNVAIDALYGSTGIVGGAVTWLLARRSPPPVRGWATAR